MDKLVCDESRIRIKRLWGSFEESMNFPFSKELVMEVIDNIKQYITQHPGSKPITRIEAYNENGQYATVPFYSVYVYDPDKGIEKIWRRLPAHMCVVEYY